VLTAAEFGQASTDMIKHNRSIPMKYNHTLPCSRLGGGHGQIICHVRMAGERGYTNMLANSNTKFKHGAGSGGYRSECT
jgi:hypothetical protein